MSAWRALACSVDLAGGLRSLVHSSEQATKTMADLYGGNSRQLVHSSEQGRQCALIGSHVRSCECDSAAEIATSWCVTPSSANLGPGSRSSVHLSEQVWQCPLVGSVVHLSEHNSTRLPIRRRRALRAVHSSEQRFRSRQSHTQIAEALGCPGGFCYLGALFSRVPTTQRKERAVFSY